MPLIHNQQHHHSYSGNVQATSKMGMRQVANIELIDQPANGYTSGDIVKGVIHLKLQHALTVQCVKLQLLGASQNRAQATESFSFNRRFFAMQRILWPESETIPCSTCSNSDDDDNNENSYNAGVVTIVSDTVSEFSKGNYCWPFALQFPEYGQRLPSSTEMMQNFIRYSLKLTIVRPYGCDDLAEFVPITFNERIDVAMPSLACPVYLREKASVPVGNTWNRLVNAQCQPVEVDVTLSKKGYQPGETISILVDIRHFTACFLQDAVEVTLRQKCIYANDNKQTCSDEITLVKQTNHIHATPEKDFHAMVPIRLSLPVDVPPTNTALDSLKVTYTLNIQARVTTNRHIGNCTVTLSTPITIGTENSKDNTNYNSDWWQSVEAECPMDLDDLPPPYTPL